MTDLLELAARVEVAHEVETRALLEEAFPLFHAKKMAAKPGFANWNPIWLQFQQFVSVKAFTDAAMLLVPEGRFVGECNQCDVGGEWYARIEGHDAVYEDAIAAIPALALLAACLRARAHGGGEG